MSGRREAEEGAASWRKWRSVESGDSGFSDTLGGASETVAAAGPEPREAWCSEPAADTCRTCFNSYDDGSRCGRCCSCLRGDDCCPLCVSATPGSHMTPGSHVRSFQARLQHLSASPASHSPSHGHNSHSHNSHSESPSSHSPSLGSSTSHGHSPHTHSSTASLTALPAASSDPEPPPDPLPRKPARGAKPTPPPLDAPAAPYQAGQVSQALVNNHASYQSSTGAAFTAAGCTSDREACSPVYNEGSQTGGGAACSPSLPSLAGTLDRALRREGYAADQARNRRPVMAAHSARDHLAAPRVTGPIVPSLIPSGGSRSPPPHSPPPPVPARHPRSEFGGPGGHGGRGLGGHGGGGLWSRSASTLSYTGPSALPPDTDHGASVQDIRRRVTSLMMRFHGDVRPSDGLLRPTAVMSRSQSQQDAPPPAACAPEPTYGAPEPTYGAHRLTLNERGYLTQTGVRAAPVDIPAAPHRTHAAASLPAHASWDYMGGYPTVSGAGGYPIVSGAGGYPTVSGTGGYPTVSGAGGYPTMSGAGCYPTVSGTEGYPIVSGAGGNSTVSGAGGYHTVSGTEGYPIVSGAGGYPTVSGMGGYPTVSGAGGYPTVSGLPSSGQNTGDSGLGSEGVGSLGDLTADRSTGDRPRDRRDSDRSTSDRPPDRPPDRLPRTPHSALHADTGAVEPPPPPPAVAQQDLLARLGLLLGDRADPGPLLLVDRADPGPLLLGHHPLPMSPQDAPPDHVTGWSGCAVSDLSSCPSTPRSRRYEQRGHESTPDVSAEVTESAWPSCLPSPRMGTRLPHRTEPGQQSAGLSSRDHSVESLCSLASSNKSVSSPSSSQNAPSPSSNQNALSTHSNAGSWRQGDMTSSLRSPTGQRPHSITTSAPGQVEELFGKRLSVVRRSARSNWPRPQPDAPALAPLRSPCLSALHKLPFHAPHARLPPEFVARDWVFTRLLQELWGGQRGVVVTGASGSGKTAIIEQLLEHSFFGQGTAALVKHKYLAGEADAGAGPVGGDSPARGHDALVLLGECVVAAHACRADEQRSCVVAWWVHSLAAHLACSPLLPGYRELLLGSPGLQARLALPAVTEDPDAALLTAVLQPLATLPTPGPLCLLLVDGLDHAEFHRSDTGPPLAAFLARHASAFPAWLKCVATCGSQLPEAAAPLPWPRLSIDPSTDVTRHTPPPHDARLARDVQEYVLHRWRGREGALRLAGVLAGRARDSMLYAELLLSLLEQGRLGPGQDALAANPDALTDNPDTLPEDLDALLERWAREWVADEWWSRLTGPLLSVVLAALSPLTGTQLAWALCGGHVTPAPGLAEEAQREVARLVGAGVLWQRRDGAILIPHAALRHWLCRRQPGQLAHCDLRTGHYLLAFRLSRVDRPLNAEKTFELAHHILKAHIYKQAGRALGLPSRELHAHWLAESSRDLSAALTTASNVFTPNIKVSRLLLLAGACPDSRTQSLQRAPLLCVAARQGFTQLVTLLLNAGAHPNLTGEDGTSALCYASQNGHVQIIRALIQNGAKPHLTDCEGRGPAVHAALCDQLDALNVLLQCDWAAAPHHRNAAMQQALVAAAAQGHAQVCEFLLRLKGAAGEGFDVNLTDTLLTETALTAAAASGRAAVVALLLGGGANAGVRNARGVTAAGCAARGGHQEALGALLRSGAEVEAGDRQQRTPLMLAAGEGHLAVVETLLSHGASVSLRDRDGLGALGWAALRGHVLCGRALLAAGAALEATDRNERTPLDLAAHAGYPDMVQFLLERGACMEHTDISGLRPLDRAIGARHAAVVTCFLRKGAKLGPATWAMAQGKPEVLLMLLSKLLEDGNILYRKQRVKDAAHRYSYALKKFPGECGPDSRAFTEVKVTLMLNLARCRRKTQDYAGSVELATRVLELRPRSFEALYARARAYRDLRELGLAARDLHAALQIAPDHPELRRLQARLQAETSGEDTPSSAAGDSRQGNSASEPSFSGKAQQVGD